MAAILTPTNLVVLEHSSLKHPPSTVEPTCPLPPLPSSLAWSPETNSIFLSSATSGIQQYNLTNGSLQDISAHDHPTDQPIVSLLSKDRGSSLVYSRGSQAVVISTQTGKISNTFDTHKSAITSLSLSNDSTLLASTSAHAIHVHNLTLASHTVLRGVPMGLGTITTCSFHPHSRTRLLLGFGPQLLVYDTTRPSGPAKVISMDKDHKNAGDITAITCSPFSKTLVAVGCSGGIVALVDLEKEKGVFRMVPMPAPLTCLSFSAEGAALYAGTENGKLLILDLRGLDKPPKSITVSENGDQVIAISVQRKLKSGEAVKPVPTATTKPLVQRDTNKIVPAVRHPGVSTGTSALKKANEDNAGTKAKPSASTKSTTPRRTASRTVSNPIKPRGSPAAKRNPDAHKVNPGTAKSPVAARSEALKKKTFSPLRSPVTLADKDQGEDDGDLSVPVEELLALPKAKEPTGSSGEAPVSSASARLPSTLSRPSSRAHISEVAKPRTDTRTDSPSHLGAAESVSTAFPRMRSAPSVSAASGTSRTSLRRTVSSSSASPPAAQHRRVSGSSATSRISRTPSPELPGMEEDGGPVTPIPAYKQTGKARIAALGLGTPEIDEWVKAGEGNAKAGDTKKEGKRVGFADDSDSEAEEIVRVNHDPDGEADAPARPVNARLPRGEGPELAMQVSPRRSFAGPSPGMRPRTSTSWAPVPSPLRNPAGPPSPQARAAHDMLQALLRDALYDFRQETKAEIVGLHLDLIRMGTSWRSEMRTAMGEFAEEMRELREENRRLREENERLRRGY